MCSVVFYERRCYHTWWIAGVSLTSSTPQPNTGCHAPNTKPSPGRGHLFSMPVGGGEEEAQRTETEEQEKKPRPAWGIDWLGETLATELSGCSILSFPARSDLCRSGTKPISRTTYVIHPFVIAIKKSFVTSCLSFPPATTTRSPARNDEPAANPTTQT